MKNMLHHIVLFLMLGTCINPLIGQGTGYNLSLMDDMDFQKFLSNIDLNSTDLSKYYDGSVYLFKEPKEAKLNFLHSKAQKVTAMVNYNVQKSTFDVTTDDWFFGFSAKELRSVTIDGISFVPNSRGVFYKQIFSNKDLEVVEEYSIKIEAQSQLVGYESKKNDQIKIEKNLFLITSDAKLALGRTRSGLQKALQIDKNELKSYLKSEKLNLKSDTDLNLVFSYFYN